MLPSANIDAKILHKNKQPKWKKQNPPALHEECDDDVHKKLMRRYTERLRRQEMATLSASLRSLLPYEYIKGKRSISDQLNEAATYIRHLQNRIKDLGAERNKLRMLSKLNVSDTEIATFNPTNVIVGQCLGGIEVAVSSSIKFQMLPLSRLLDILLKDGHTIVNCVYAKVEGRQIYTIRTQVSDQLGMDLSSLQRKLAEALPSSSNSSL